MCWMLHDDRMPSAERSPLRLQHGTCSFGLLSSLQVAKQGGIQQLASSSGSGFVISGSQGITQVPQAVLHQVAVDTGLVQVPQPSTPAQAPPASVRQVNICGICFPVLATVYDDRDLLSAAAEGIAQACMGLQVSFIEGNGVATAAPLTAQALGHLRGTAASSAGPASRYSEIQSATQATGGDIAASTSITHLS